MENQALVVGTLIFAFIALIPLFNYVNNRVEARHRERMENIERDYETREKQIKATHEQTLATNENTHELKFLRKDVNDLEERTTNLENTVYKKDRT